MREEKERCSEREGERAERRQKPVFWNSAANYSAFGARVCSVSSVESDDNHGSEEGDMAGRREGGTEGEGGRRRRRGEMGRRNRRRGRTKRSEPSD